MKYTINLAPENLEDVRNLENKIFLQASKIEQLEARNLTLVKGFQAAQNIIKRLEGIND